MRVDASLMFGERLLHAGTSIKRPKVIKVSSDFQTLERAEMKRPNEPERLDQPCGGSGPGKALFGTFGSFKNELRRVA